MLPSERTYFIDETNGSNAQGTQNISGSEEESFEELLDKIKNTDFYKSNIAIFEKLINELKSDIVQNKNTIDEIKKLINQSIEHNEQSTTTGNCWFLAAINTFIDDGKGALSDFIHYKADGSIGVTFKPCTIKITGTSGVNHEINVNDMELLISKDEINAAEYKNIGLSTGDADLKAMEIAWYKLCEKLTGELPQIGQSPEVSLSLLYGGAKYVFGYQNISIDITKIPPELENDAKLVSIIPILLPVFLFKQNLYYKKNHKVLREVINSNQQFEGLDFSELNPNSVFGTHFNIQNDTNWKNTLKVKAQMLYDSAELYGYDCAEIKKAYDDCLKRKFSSEQHDEGCTVLIDVPTYKGKTVGIYGNHAYTFAGRVYHAVEGKVVPYVKLINPHNNSETFEIPEIYAKFLFDGVAWPDSTQQQNSN